tara:strand:- start:97 stop:360 length:264 start_codon:yes stop_codon:yes gene_type:complete
MVKIMKSPIKNKKYRIVYNNKNIDFGDVRYGQYKDSSPLKLYSKLDTLDKKRRLSYWKRHKAIRLKDGSLAYLNKNQASYWSLKYLW